MIKFSATLLATLIAASVNAATVDLRIMETTDLHSNMMDFDYYKDAATENRKQKASVQMPAPVT